jgi:hypothetical protein
MKWSEVTAADRDRVRTEAERPLTLEEWNAYLAQVVTNDERESIESLLDWFARRYPTAGARVRYARRAYQRWTAGAGG